LKTLAAEKEAELRAKSAASAVEGKKMIVDSVARNMCTFKLTGKQLVEQKVRMNDASL
jgi:hypothetical protein